MQTDISVYLSGETELVWLMDLIQIWLKSVSIQILLTTAALAPGATKKIQFCITALKAHDRGL